MRYPAELQERNVRCATAAAEYYRNGTMPSYADALDELAKERYPDWLLACYLTLKDEHRKWRKVLKAIDKRASRNKRLVEQVNNGDA